jgi:protein gp37
MTKTTIEWATDVWNPTTGCTKVSPGCKNCYAERIANRFWGERKFSDVQCHPERLDQLRRWRKPRRIFVDSMSDLFHPDVPDDFIWKVFETMILGNRRHTYMILTKRPARMKAWFDVYQERFWNYHAPNQTPREYVTVPWPDPCIWLGVSVENQQAADERIPLLLQTPAAVRFVSVEPMLEKIDLWKFATREETFGSMYDYRGEYEFYQVAGFPKGKVKISEGIDWVICGCESGSGARPMELDWARSLRDQCQDAGVPFFLKQAAINGKLVKMPELDGKVWAEYPL